VSALPHRARIHILKRGERESHACNSSASLSLSLCLSLSYDPRFDLSHRLASPLRVVPPPPPPLEMHGLVARTLTPLDQLPLPLPLGGSFPLYRRKKARHILTAEDAEMRTSFFLLPLPRLHRTPLSRSPQASQSTLCPRQSVLRPIGSCASRADGDKSAAIADINRYERGRQTKYTNVNIRAAWEGAGRWWRARTRARARVARRGEDASNANGKSRAAGLSSPSLFLFSSPLRRSPATTLFESGRAAPRGRSECQMQFDKGERGRGRTIGARPRGRLLSARYAISGGAGRRVADGGGRRAHALL